MTHWNWNRPGSSSWEGWI